MQKRSKEQLRHWIAIQGNGMVCMASQGNGDEQKGGAKQRNGEASQRKAKALNRAHLTERQRHGNEPLISDEQWHGRSKRRKLGDGNSKHSMNGKANPS